MQNGVDMTETDITLIQYCHCKVYWQDDQFKPINVPSDGHF